MLLYPPQHNHREKITIMPKYQVTITRISTAEVETEIDAPNPEAAQAIGYEIAGNQDYPSSRFGFEILPENIQEIPAELEEPTILLSITSPYCHYCDESDIAIDDSKCWNCGMPIYNC